MSGKYVQGSVRTTTYKRFRSSPNFLLPNWELVEGNLYFSLLRDEKTNHLLKWRDARSFSEVGFLQPKGDPR
ncbi:hypothetical protein D4R75_03075 [bacterium]|nr:MAG: hypothetical protein D4R75_03075 [bacterium]